MTSRPGERWHPTVARRAMVRGTRWQSALLCSLAVIAGCHSETRPTSPRAGARAAPMLTIDVGPCLGTCPTYSVVVHDDGSLVYTGGEHVAERGERRARLSPETLSAIARAFEQARFFELDDSGRLPSPPVTTRSGETATTDFRDDVVCGDTSHTRVSYERAGRRRTLDDAHCEETELSRLEARVLALLPIQAWVGAVERR